MLNMLNFMSFQNGGTKIQKYVDVAIIKTSQYSGRYMRHLFTGAVVKVSQKAPKNGTTGSAQMLNSFFLLISFCENKRIHDWMRLK